MKANKGLLMILFAATFFAAAATAQNKKNNIQPLIDSQNYVFEAQFVQPLTETAKPLTGTYTVSVTRDTIVASLPYFGRVYEAPVDPSHGGIEFTSTTFGYVKKPIKNGWSIAIQPKESGNGNQLYFTVFNNGSASLQVTSNSRQGIGFNGFIRRPNNEQIGRN